MNAPQQQPQDRDVLKHKRKRSQHEEKQKQEQAPPAPKDLTAALISRLKLSKAARRSHYSNDRLLLRMQQTHHESIKKRTEKPIHALAVGRALCVASVAPTACKLNGISPMFSLNSDLMGCCMTYLEPPDVHSLLTAPISKHWSSNFTSSEELWRTLCIMEPFKALIEDEDNESVEGVASLYSGNHLFGKFRLLFTSFVRCMRFLAYIKDDAVHGRPPSVAAKKNLKKLPLTEARDITRSTKKHKTAKQPPSCRLNTPDVNLPLSCAISAIKNWMVAYSDVEGIQTMCLNVFPFLLEDENQRSTAQLAGLTDIVLRSMEQFPVSVGLHTAAFHTMVLLARPLGGKEGMLFHSSMVNSSGILNSGSSSGRNGIAVMLDSMKRFESEAVLQAMSCWSMVNIALAPSQKTVLVKLGGIKAIINAMTHHPHNAEVQFRALFALINLVIPSARVQEGSTEEVFLQEKLGKANETTEKELLDESVVEIANLVVVAMKNFHSSENILNRACLVLNNLSFANEYHETLLRTPNFYQMLEWCLATYPTDQVLQQSAAATLHRVMTMSINDELRARLTAEQYRDAINFWSSSSPAG